MLWYIKLNPLTCVVFFGIVNLTMAWVQNSVINDTGTLMSDLLMDYNLYVRPALELNETVNVSMSLIILSIKQYDEREGTLSFIAVLGLGWNDSRLSWDPYYYGGIEEILIGYDDVWVPDLYCVNSAVTFMPVGTKKERVRFYYDGYALFAPGALFTVSCAGNMEEYPYDSQECHISFNAWNYNEGELSLYPDSGEINLSEFASNNMWTVGKTRVESGLYTVGGQLDFFLEIRRKSKFVTINVIVPLLFLSCLNNLVFLLVPESGERISFCITVLLSISVYLTILNQTLPQSSEPIPVVSYKVTADLATSYLIILMVIINLKLYNKHDNEKVPPYIQTICQCLSCGRRRNKDIKPSDGPENKKNTDVSSSLNDCIENSTEMVKFQAKLPQLKEAYEPIKQSVTWKDVCATLDIVCFIVFNCFTVCSFYLFIRVTYMDN